MISRKAAKHAKGNPLFKAFLEYFLRASRPREPFSGSLPFVCFVVKTLHSGLAFGYGQVTRAHIARRMAGIEPFHVMDLLARARRLEAAGRSIVHLEIGEPGFPTPEPIMEAGRKALADGHTHYTPAVGLPALREAIAGFYRDRHGVDVSPERIIITPGASGALLLVMAVLLDPGDQVLMADPGYPCNRHFVRTFEGEAVSVPWAPTPPTNSRRSIWNPAGANRSVAAMVASPANPTGTLVPVETMKRMLDFTAAGEGGSSWTRSTTVWSMTKRPSRRSLIRRTSSSSTASPSTSA
jgi:hypothetical protein